MASGHSGNKRSDADLILPATYDYQGSVCAMGCHSNKPAYSNPDGQFPSDSDRKSDERSRYRILPISIVGNWQWKSVRQDMISSKTF